MADPQFVPLDPNAQYDEQPGAPAPTPPAGGGFVPLPPDATYDTGGAIPSAVAAAAGSNLTAHPGPPQMEGPLRDPAMIASGVAKGAITGMGALGDLTDYGQGLVARYLHDPLYRAITGNNPPGAPPPPGIFSSSSLLAGPRAVGAVDNPALTPQDNRERNITAGSEGMGGAIPYLPLGGISAGRALLGGTLGGVAGEQAAEAFPDHPVLARTIGNLAVGGAVGGAPRAAPNETEQAFTRLGITNPLPGDVLGGWRQKLTARAGDMPAGGAVRAQQANVIDQWGRAVDDIAGNIAGPGGAPQTAQQAGQALQQSSTNWLGRFNNYSRQLWGDVDMAIPPGTPTPVTNYARTLNDVASSMPAAPATGRVLQSDFTRNLLDGLIADVQRGPLDWQSVSAIRTRIGSMITDPQLIGGPNVTELRRIYGALSSDMQAAARAQGPTAQQAFDNASTFTRTGHDYIDSTISNFIGRRGAVGPGGIEPEAAYSNAMADARLGGTLLQNVRNGMPEAADQLGAYELRARGQATPGQQGVPGQGQTWSPTTFVTRTNPGNLSREATDALFPGVQNQLDDLRTTAGAMRETERAVNRSGTGPYLATKELLDVLRNAGVAGAGGYAAAGWPGAVAGAVGGAVSPFIPGALGAWLSLRAPRNYSGLLQQPARSYGGIAAPTSGP